MIKAICFDYMGVLLFKRADYMKNDLVDEIDNEVGRVTNDNEFKKQTLEKYTLTETEFNQILETLVQKYTEFDSLWKMLPELRSKYKLAIINNGTALTLPLHKEIHKLDQEFDLFISSAIEGIRKPNPDIYLLAAKRLGVEPNECLFMDDSKQNIEGARSIGMKTIWWSTKELGYADFMSFLTNDK